MWLQCAWTLTCFSAWAAADPLTLESPADWQVFQRFSQERGLLRVAGKADPNIVAVQFRLIPQGTTQAVPDGWKSVPSDPVKHTFSAELEAPAGGWHRLEIEAKDESRVVERKTVEHVGIGEVFVVAGQSNAANHGSVRTSTQTSMVSTWDGHRWSLAKDPLRGASGDGGSFLPAFGDALHQHCKVPVGLLPVAVGGTSVREWLPKGDKMQQQPTTGAHVVPVKEGGFASTGELFDKLARTLSGLGLGGCRAVLWHQGESDAGQARSGYPADRQITGGQYAEYLERVIRVSRNRAAWPVPWFTAQATYHAEADPSDAEFREAQALLWKRGVAWPGPDTDGLRKEFRDGVHFNAAGLKRHGQMWAEKVIPWLDSQTAPPRDGPSSPDYKLVWQDEFDGKTMDLTKWAHRSVGKRNAGYIDPACVSLDGQGHLVITLKKVGEEFHGGMIATEKTKRFKYGYFESRVKVATQPGMNTAFWIQAARMAAPDRGTGAVDDTANNGTEIDILEYISRQGEVAHFNLHWNGYGKWHKSLPADAWLHGLRKGFHTYAVEWTPDGYRFFVDGRLSWQASEAISHTEEYVILDLEPSAWAGGLDKAVLPASAEFDWVRIWQKTP